MKRLPDFFRDSSDKDGKGEALFDYWLGWTLRCAPIEYHKIHPKVNEYARNILIYLMFGKNDSNEEYHCDIDKYKDIQIDSIEVWKQDFQIDLWCHIILSDGSKHALIIENKYYTKLKVGQLERYRKSVEQYYYSRPEFHGNVKHLFITCLEEIYEVDKKLCQSFGFSYLPAGNLKAIIGKEPTGNDLFDEFWFNWF